MTPSWKHGVAAGLVISALLAVALIISDAQQNNSSQVVFLPVNQLEEIQTVLAAEQEKLPFGGLNLMPSYRLVALYGNPEYRGLGALGEQPLDQTIERVKKLAEAYQPLSDEKVIPTFEIITTIASAGPTENNDYSQELTVEKLKPWIDAAKEQGIYVILDLQPGRSTFLSQATLYESLLKEPHVGLALDPEWRLLTASSRHLVSIGSVSATELNEASAWLSELVKKHALPQKLFLVHQFKKSMITERESLITNYENLAYMIHMDGHGAPNSKTRSWNTVKEGLPESVFLGWKNFYDEDKPTPSPGLTMQQEPKPWMVSYQ